MFVHSHGIRVWFPWMGPHGRTYHRAIFETHWSMCGSSLAEFDEETTAELEKFGTVAEALVDEVISDLDLSPEGK